MASSSVRFTVEGKEEGEDGKAGSSSRGRRSVTSCTHVLCWPSKKRYPGKSKSTLQPQTAWEMTSLLESSLILMPQIFSTKTSWINRSFAPSAWCWAIPLLKRSFSMWCLLDLATGCNIRQELDWSLRVVSQLFRPSNVNQMKDMEKIKYSSTIWMHV